MLGRTYSRTQSFVHYYLIQLSVYSTVSNRNSHDKPTVWTTAITAIPSGHRKFTATEGIWARQLYTRAQSSQKLRNIWLSHEGLMQFEFPKLRVRENWSSNQSNIVSELSVNIFLREVYGNRPRNDEPVRENLATIVVVEIVHFWVLKHAADIQDANLLNGRVWSV